MLYYSNKKKNSGFSLIEIMVVIAIVGILATVAVINMGRNPDRDVRLEKDRFTSFLRSTQNQALSSQKVSPKAGCSISEKTCGFGIHFENDKSVAQVYFVQTGGATPQDVDCASSSVSKAYSSSDDCSKLDSFTLSHNMNFGTDKDIFFLIPSGEIYSGSNSTPVSTDQEIDIKFVDDAAISVPVTITPAGIIK